MHGKRRFPGKRVFWWGGGGCSNFRENGARKAFGGSVLNEFEFPTSIILEKYRWEDNGSIYIATNSSERNLICR